MTVQNNKRTLEDIAYDKVVICSDVTCSISRSIAYTSESVACNGCGVGIPIAGFVSISLTIVSASV